MSGQTPGPFFLEEWQLHSAEPESLNVGQLNRAVRMLREENYQQALVRQDLLEALREVAHHADDECGFMVSVRAAIAKATGR